MTQPGAPIRIATRGSPLALAQAHQVLDLCVARLPHRRFELNIVRTTGDKLQRASLAHPDQALPKGLFTKELEVALTDARADLAVHSLKDLPTELPPALTLGAVPEREDPRDVLITRSHPVPNPPPDDPLGALPPGAVVATGSNRRREQLLSARPDLRVEEIRGNVGTRLQKLLENVHLDALVLAAAGLHRLGYQITPDGLLLPSPNPGAADVQPSGSVSPFRAVLLPLDLMLPCVGQAALGIEIRQNDPFATELCRHLDHLPSHRAVTAERAFLHGMGGGCQSPVAAWAASRGDQLELRAVSFRDGTRRSGVLSGPLDQPDHLGEALADRLR